MYSTIPTILSLWEIQLKLLKFAGDIAFRVLDSINSVSQRAFEDHPAKLENDTQIYVCDINLNMLNVGKKRALEKGIMWA